MSTIASSGRRTAGVALPPGVLLRVSGLGKTFVMHLQGGQRLPIIAGAAFEVRAGECAVLGGPSGAGKSSLLKMVYGNYSASEGSVLVAAPEGAIDMASADARTVLRLRRGAIGYVSQFLRCVPRVAALDVVAEPLVERGESASAARDASGALLARLGIPERLWGLPPATFSGGEQQRVNIARGFLADQPLLLLDEPTASLDARNRDVVVEMIEEKKRRGGAMLAIFHDAAVRDRVADTVIDVSEFAAGANGHEREGRL